MRRKRTARRRSNGFTLVEIITVVAIVAIAAAMAIPSLGNMLINMEMARLDSAAKQIYLVGQNRLVSMRESGTLAQLAAGGGFKSVSLTETGGSAMKYYVASSDDTSAAALAELLPGGAIDYRLEESGHYLIVFLEGNKGLMREVYYSERPFSNWNASMLDSWRGNPAARRRARIGFYDGGAVSMGAVQQLDTPTLEVVNGETLELHVVLPDTVSDPHAVKLDLVLTDLSNEANKEEWELAFPAGFDRMETDPKGKTIYVKVLDKLFTSGKSFAEVCPKITPGADIQVAATLVPEAGSTGGVTYLPSTPAYQVTNSLFAAMGTEVRIIGGVPYSNLQFHISSGRHLQNLDLLKPTGDDANGPAQIVVNKKLQVPSGGQPLSDYFSALQTKEIDWEGNYGDRSFSPINGASNKYYGLAFYNGNNYAIKHIRIEEFHSGIKCAAWGIFGDLSNLLVPSWENGEVKGVRICEPYVDVKGLSYSSVGALGGTFLGINVVDCHVYVEDISNKNNFMILSQEPCSYIGGLVGLTIDGSVSYSSVSLSRVSGNASYGMGGLVGFLSSNSNLINSCYANVEELRNEGTGGSGIGMLVGETEAYITNSYGVGNISGKAEYIAGLVGGDGGGNSRNRYVVNSYALVTFGDITTNHSIQAITHSDTDQVQTAYFCDLDGSFSDGKAIAGRGIECSLDELNDKLLGTGAPGGWLSGVTAYPYSSTPVRIYPYPGLPGSAGGGMIHYGNWPS